MACISVSCHCYLIRFYRLRLHDLLLCYVLGYTADPRMCFVLEKHANTCLSALWARLKAAREGAALRCEKRKHKRSYSKVSLRPRCATRK